MKTPYVGACVVAGMASLTIAVKGLVYLYAGAKFRQPISVDARGRQSCKMQPRFDDRFAGER
ncbi:hypothetical protein DOZ69_12845 [Pseudomonas fluorescens]|nr:hypothetical protein DOZ69_12845 [Pseudomonas fluorescens]